MPVVVCIVFVLHVDTKELYVELHAAHLLFFFFFWCFVWCVPVCSVFIDYELSGIVHWHLIEESLGAMEGDELNA